MTAPVVVMGVSGAGKSTVGAALARRLRLPFGDADHFHPAANIAKMSAGHPLGDGDRFPWLEIIGRWLSDHPEGAVMSCSALKRRYRDQLRSHCPEAEFLHLYGSPAVIERRQAGRHGHFVPASLLDSQFAALEALGRDERGISIDVDQTIDAIVAKYLAASAPRPTERNR
jgi:gluconokinase